MNMNRMWISLAMTSALVACNGNSGFSGASPSSAAAGSGGYDNGTSGDGDNQDTAVSGANVVTDALKISKDVDLVIALDSSGSMSEESAGVSQNLNKLILTLQQGSLDPRIHLITGPGGGIFPSAAPFTFPPNVDGSKVAHVLQPIGSHDALGKVKLTLSGAYTTSYRTVQGAPMNPPLAFRPEAKLEILVISDDNGENGQRGGASAGNTANDFDPSNQWKATVSGVVGIPNSSEAAGVCDIAAVGQEYITLAMKTGGTILDICSPDWSMIIGRFTDGVLKRSQSIQLSKTPADPTRLIVSYDGKVLPRDAWTYDAATRLVTLASSVTVNVGVELKVKYEAKP